jgi:hypothetical protein
MPFYFISMFSRCPAQVFGVIIDKNFNDCARSITPANWYGYETGYETI